MDHGQAKRFTDREHCIARTCNGGTWCGREVKEGEQIFPSVEAAAGMPGNVCRSCWGVIHDSFCYRNNEVLGPYSLGQALSAKHKAETQAHHAMLLLERVMVMAEIHDDALVLEIKEVLRVKQRDWLWVQMGEPIGDCSVLFSLPVVDGKRSVHRGWTEGTPIALRATLDQLQLDIGMPEEDQSGAFPNICRVSMGLPQAETVRDFINKLLDPKTIVPAELRCPNDKCRQVHVDRGEWETRPHKTHLCESCGKEWRPSERYTVGVPWVPR